MGDYLWSEEYEPDDGLGYYTDGTKRTLTNEQIAIFRHSEIQALIKQHRYAVEDSEPSHSPHRIQDSRTSHQTNNLEHFEEVEGLPSESKSMDISNDGDSPKLTSQEIPRIPTPDFPLDPRDKSFERHRKAGQKRSYKPEKRNADNFKQSGEDKTFRRICREADEQKSESVDLDY